MLDQPPPIPRRINRYRRRGTQRPDALMQDDPPFSFYALVLAIDDAAGHTAGDDQLHLALDAAYVTWYRQLADPMNPPPLNGVGLQSGARLLELIQSPAQFDALNQYLLQTVYSQLSESSWWMLTPAHYNFRQSVHLEQFQPPLFALDPAQVGHPDARQSDFFVLPRLLVPRNLFRQGLFALRDRF